MICDGTPISSVSCPNLHHFQITKPTSNYSQLLNLLGSKEPPNPTEPPKARLVACSPGRCGRTPPGGSAWRVAPHRWEQTPPVSEKIDASRRVVWSGGLVSSVGLLMFGYFLGAWMVGLFWFGSVSWLVGFLRWVWFRFVDLVGWVGLVGLVCWVDFFVDDLL